MVLPAGAGSDSSPSHALNYHDRRVELSAGEELEPREEDAAVDGDTSELPHHGFGVFHQPREPAAHPLQDRQREFCPDPFLGRIADRLAV